MPKGNYSYGVARVYIRLPRLSDMQFDAGRAEAWGQGRLSKEVGVEVEEREQQQPLVVARSGRFFLCKHCRNAKNKSACATSLPPRPQLG